MYRIKYIDIYDDLGRKYYVSFFAYRSLVIRILFVEDQILFDKLYKMLHPVRWTKIVLLTFAMFSIDSR